MTLPSLLLADRWFLGILFVLAAVPKLTDLGAFEVAVARYGLESVRATRVVARTLPPAELLIGLLLAAGVEPEIVGPVGGIVLLAFALAMALNLAMGRSFDCGCGFGDKREIGWRLVARNSVLAALGGVLAFGPTGALGLVGGRMTAGTQADAFDFVAIPLVVLLLAAAVRLFNRALTGFQFTFAGGRLVPLRQLVSNNEKEK